MCAFLLQGDSGIGKHVVQTEQEVVFEILGTQLLNNHPTSAASVWSMLVFPQRLCVSERDESCTLRPRMPHEHVWLLSSRSGCVVFEGTFLAQATLLMPLD